MSAQRHGQPPGVDASGSDADRRWWVPVGADEAVRDLPHPGQVMDTPLVLWRRADGRVAAFEDRCPHRGARLSLGRVCDGRLECPYHGWRFDGDGACVSIPALPAFTPPDSHAATAWQVQEAHGLLWVAPPNTAASDPFGPPRLPGLPERQVLCGPYEVATSAPRVVENFLDTAHFAFVHGGFLGERGHAHVPDYRVVHDAHGRPGVPDYRAWQPQPSSATGGAAWVDYAYQVLGPGAALLTKKPVTDRPPEAYALWACPLAHDRCRVWFTLFTTPDAGSDDVLRSFQDTIFRQDQPVLESQRPRRLPPPDDEAHCAADRLTLAYRRWLFATGFTWGAGLA
jgi:phenylpropionate dioxygenase-like ring-hydroxylating dioxygenase large terminal subunit